MKLAGMPVAPDMAKVKRLAIVKLSSIGDVIHALPVSAALGKSFPHLEITWIVEEMSAPMVVGNPYLHDVYVIPAEFRKRRKSTQGFKQFLGLRTELQKYRFDVCIDLQGLSKSALVAWSTSAKYKYGYDWLRELAPFIVTRVPRRPQSLHVIDQFLDVADFLGADVSNPEFPLDIPAEATERARELMREIGVDLLQPFIVINPSSGGGGHKGWGTSQFADMLGLLPPTVDDPIVLIGSKSDIPVAEELAALSSHPVHSLVGKTNLKELAAVLKASRLHICGDTGSAHMAAALGTRVVSIFGRSNPDRLAPYGQERWVVHRRDCCHDVCLKFHETAPINSKQKCLAPPPVCLTAVRVEHVVEKVMDALTYPAEPDNSLLERYPA